MLSEPARLFLHSDQFRCHVPPGALSPNIESPREGLWRRRLETEGRCCGSRHPLLLKAVPIQSKTICLLPLQGRPNGPMPSPVSAWSGRVAHASPGRRARALSVAALPMKSTPRWWSVTSGDYTILMMVWVSSDSFSGTMSNISKEGGRC